MKLCIPTTTKDGLKASVCEHFGSAPFFTIYDSDNDTVEIIDNSQENHVHGACQPMKALEGKKIDAVVCGGMGPRAVQKLNYSGIKTLRAIDNTVEEVIKKFGENLLEEINSENSCHHHNCK
jgi:predicted Fe-Mo cluster-binding NifX family protein